MKVLITGATRGIGRACAEKFAAAGDRVTTVARSGADLSLDLTRELPDQDRYDVLILNAAAYAPGKLLDTEADVFSQFYELNVLANHRMARRFLPPMLEAGHGHLIVIGSTATDDTSPHMTAYAATKRALRGLFECWQLELANTGVRSTLIAPGATLTSSWDGQPLPPKILDPAAVANLVYDCVRQGREGRQVIKAQ